MGSELGHGSNEDCALGTFCAADSSLWPAGQAFPGTSTINVTAGTSALANGAIVPLRYNGANAVEPSLQLVYGTTSAGATHVVIDIAGYFIDANLHEWGLARPGPNVYGRVGFGRVCATAGTPRPRMSRMA